MAKLNLETLEKWLWDSANILRGHIDSSDFKNYIFGLMFLKRASDQFFEEAKIAIEKEGIDLEEAIEDEDYHRFFIPKNAWWSEITKKTENIGQAIDQAFSSIEEYNSSLEGVMTAVHFGDSEKLPDSLLSRLLQHFNKYSLANSDLENPDILGNSYEYLIRQFADDSGKKGGEFYTPKEVVQLLVQLIKPEAGNSIYDPTCGSGGMLIESAHYIAKNGGMLGEYVDCTLKGQEKNLGTWAVCKINMIVHNFKDSDIRKGDTLGSPKHIINGELETFDRVIANPPFSLSNWWEAAEVDIKNDAKGNPITPKYNDLVSDEYGRFKYGIPPRSYGDLAFLQHMLSVLKQNGKMGIVLPHGVLFRGSSEGKIREALLKEDFIEAIIGLPEKLFYNTGIPASIIIINKSKPQELKNKVIIIDASKEYKEGKNQNTLNPESIEKTVKAYENMQDVEKFMRIVALEEIKENDYNLNIARYIDTSEEEEIINIENVINKITDIEEKEKEIDTKLNEYLKTLGFVL
ncbi:type I restriction-modification system subunit M [Aliarcobacter butzleri]|uniref:type I restriction-modification system subunit M n=1 Tax=Aliarcobacter butzleri TaxID=28197 RepID=UPI0021B541B6|nr:type I restriction-modification system subunit M [Aliarcobacter butzleri]MCT7565299.1 type I restriction-modification system subunit M [Aliarcobacter butzleri]